MWILAVCILVVQGIKALGNMISCSKFYTNFSRAPIANLIIVNLKILSIKAGLDRLHGGSSQFQPSIQ